MKLDSMMRELRALLLLVRVSKRPHVRGCGLFTAACTFAAPARPLAPFFTRASARSVFHPRVRSLRGVRSLRSLHSLHFFPRAAHTIWI